MKALFGFGEYCIFYHGDEASSAILTLSVKGYTTRDEREESLTHCYTREKQKS